MTLSAKAVLILNAVAQLFPNSASGDATPAIPFEADKKRELFSSLSLPHQTTPYKTPRMYVYIYTNYIDYPCTLCIPVQHTSHPSHPHLLPFVSQRVALVCGFFFVFFSAFSPPGSESVLPILRWHRQSPCAIRRDGPHPPTRRGARDGASALNSDPFRLLPTGSTEERKTDAIGCRPFFFLLCFSWGFVFSNELAMMNLRACVCV